MTTEATGGIVVTGGARGIGLSIAQHCARQGYGVVIADLNVEEQYG